VRKRAVFWLGQRAGAKVAGELQQAADDPDEEVREMAVFAVSQLPREQAVPELIKLAGSHKSAGVREKAIFWLGQTGDPRALDFIESILVDKN
jgi:HEAT repeat protein